jgi:tryptophan-rich sensory protein
VKPAAKDMLAFVVSLVVCLLAADLGAWFTSQSLEPWYAQLRKPGFAPSNWVFGPVWTTLYLLMAIAAWLVWRARTRTPALYPLLLFAMQLSLNVAWSFCFFYLRRPELALADIILLWLAILATLLAFLQSSGPAGCLMAPYLLWVSFAAGLNYSIWRLNA